jgi:hypothetical protein
MQKTTIKLGGKNGDLTCEKCGKLRWPKSLLCPDCWEKENPGRGTLNSKGTVLQQLLPKDVWQATNFAASLISQGKHPVEAVRIAATYYKVPRSEVHSALSQRSARNRKGKGKKGRAQ